MSCTVSEVSKGYVVTNPGTTIQSVTIDATKSFSVITVFNEADQNVKITYKNTNGEIADFIVPKSGRSFTRVINGGLLNNSLQINALNIAATGSVIINLGN